MAYEKDDIEALTVKAKKKYKVTSIMHIVAYLRCSRATFYNLGIDKLDSVKEAMFDVKVKRKVKMLTKWEDSENATLQAMAYKLIADDDELERLNGDKKPVVEAKKVEIENRDKGLDDESE